jgi:hypothetical protein
MEGEYESRESGGGEDKKWIDAEMIRLTAADVGERNFPGRDHSRRRWEAARRREKSLAADAIRLSGAHTHTLDSCRLHFHRERPLRALLCDRISHDAQNRIDFRGQSNRSSTFFVCDSDCRIIGFVSLHQMAFICSRFPPLTAIIRWNVDRTCGQCVLQMKYKSVQWFS